MFSKIARERANPYWLGSFKHSFITQLAEGTLPADEFRYYLIQDRYYLEHFSKIHAMIAEKTDNQTVKEIMIKGANHLESGEVMVRTMFFKELGITDEEVAATPIAPTAYHYVSHMYRQLAEGAVSSAVAGLLPCPWLYHEIGLRLIKTGSPNELYQRWIETYSGEDSAKEVLEHCELADQLFLTSTDIEKEQMIEAFYISSQLEYLFWNMAVTKETWPKGANK
ncbi:thiaminase II [Vagococcus vulneris]|uniref:Aminopyrimidine aminohydrolase n=1 Tax=Vagococcus vulneris TaxID=1977869 RepID=A0A429ZZ47_9ENTE|nr:thiaminase II [Vagococcus vulneris]RST99271.1 thiaminase II [Vagococcus vulneris]